MRCLSSKARRGIRVKCTATPTRNAINNPRNPSTPPQTPAATQWAQRRRTALQHPRRVVRGSIRRVDLGSGCDRNHTGCAADEVELWALESTSRPMCSGAYGRNCHAADRSDASDRTGLPRCVSGRFAPGFNSSDLASRVRGSLPRIVCVAMREEWEVWEGGKASRGSSDLPIFPPSQIATSTGPFDSALRTPRRHGPEMPSEAPIPDRSRMNAARSDLIR